MYLNRFPHLRRLNLDSSEITDDALIALSDRIIEQMEILSLGNTAITEKSLTTISRCKNLQRLYLFRTAMADADMSELGELTNLVELDIAQTDISGFSLGFIAQFPSLTTIRLSYNYNIGDEAVPVLLALDPTNLLLDITATDIRTDGIERLKSHFPNLLYGDPP